jgi:branched-chain amino acid transport system ATP-binding protein
VTPPAVPLLEVEHLCVRYGGVTAVRDISFNVNAGEVVALIGANGAGKSTTLRTVSGLAELGKSVSGHVAFRGARIDRKPAHHIARLGVTHVPEGRRVFGALSVADNLLLGSYRRRGQRPAVRNDAAEVLERFPALAARRDQPAALLSGGEQQMLAIARGLMAEPTLLLLDEPSLGLSPLLVEQVFAIIDELAAAGMTILLVEQLATKALEVASRAYVLETGTVAAAGPVRDLRTDARVRSAYLGLPA